MSNDPDVLLMGPTVPVYAFDAPKPGPTVLIQAGIHGDEICGVHALLELLEADLRPAKGRMLICPVMNPPAYRAQSRAVAGGLDLNRQFPGDAAHERYEPRLAAAFMKLVLDEKPALVATLHESHKRYHPDVHPSFGQTLVYGVDPCPQVLTDVVNDLNHNRRTDEETWNTHYFPVETSSTERIVAAVGCTGVCVETWMGFPEERRVQMQREVVLRLLSSFDVISKSEFERLL